MTRFEEIGVARQENSANIVEAQNNFEKSCELCALRVGKGLTCDCCAIKRTFEDLKDLVFLPKVVVPQSAAPTKQGKRRDWKNLPIKKTIVKSEGN